MSGQVAAEPPEAPVIAAGAERSGRWSVPQVLRWALLELFALSGLAVARPLLDLIGGAPDFFAFYRAGRGQILLLLVAIVVLPAAALWLGEVAVRLVAGERWRALAHAAAMTGLFGLLAVELGKQLTPLRGKRLALAALLCAVAAGLVYRRWRTLQIGMRFLAPVPLVLALLFATVSPTSGLILPKGGAGATAVPKLTHPNRPLPPVVMIFFDEFPLQSLLDSAGRIDERVYPHFAELAADSTWFRNSTGIGGWTPYAVPGMLRGRYPGPELKSVAPDVRAYPDNLFTMFGHDYDLKVFETVTRLCPPDNCGRSPERRGITRMGADTARLYKGIVWPSDVPADPGPKAQDPAATAVARKKGPTAYFGNLKYDQVQRAADFVSSISAADRQATLYFLHLLLPHAPWKYLPDGHVYNAGSKLPPVITKGVWPLSLQQLNHQQHLLQLAWTDKVLGTVIDRLKQQGLYDQAAMVVTADHGEGFTPGDRTRGLGPYNAAQLMWVPTLIKAPHQTEGRIDDRNWEHVDLLPTVADLVGLSVPWKVDGYSQLGAPARARTDKFFYNHPGDRRVRPGPPNFQQVLHGVTDTLVKARQHGERGFYEFGQRGGWVYKSPAAIGPVVGSGGAAAIEDWDLFATIDPDAKLIPAMIAGRVTSGTPPPGSLMVYVVNGKVGATSGFYSSKPGTPADAFAGLVPDFLLEAGPGHPQIRLYLATKAVGGYDLHPMALSEDELD
jgi:hypothetical protein